MSVIPWLAAAEAVPITGSESIAEGTESEALLIVFPVLWDFIGLNGVEEQPAAIIAITSINNILRHTGEELGAFKQPRGGKPG